MTINGFEILDSLALLSTVAALLINDFDETTESKQLLGSRVVVGGCIISPCSPRGFLSLFGIGSSLADGEMFVVIREDDAF